MNLVYQYDILGRITNVLANGSSVANYGFDMVGNLQSLKYGNGVTNLYQYDAMNRLTNQVWKLNANPLASFAYTLGPTGNRTALGETVNGTSRNYGWAYDYQYRLTNETIQNIGTVNYAYDAVGNRLGRVSTMAALTNQSFIFNPNDWQTNTDNYDNNGSTIGSSGNTYQYDVMNHLTNVNSGSILVMYDGDGDRMSKKVGGTTTYYLVDEVNPSGYAQVLEEYRISSLTNVYNYGLSLISQRTLNSVLSTNYFITDGHGSTRMLTDNGGNVANAFAYDAYGTLIASNSTPQTVYLYSGQQFDPDLGLYYNRARYLNTSTGRFGIMDSYKGKNEDPLSLHKYLYAQNNPVNRIDPSGHDDFTIAGELIEIAFEAPIAEAEAAQGAIDVKVGELVTEDLELVEENAAMGGAYQDTVIGDLGAEENYSLIEGQYMSRGALRAGESRPDILDAGKKVMTEIKSVKYQRLTKQIQIQLDWIKNNPGWTYRIILDPNKNPVLSQGLKDALIKIGAKVFTSPDGIVLTPFNL